MWDFWMGILDVWFLRNRPRSKQIKKWDIRWVPVGTGRGLFLPIMMNLFMDEIWNGVFIC